MCVLFVCGGIGSILLKCVAAHAVITRRLGTPVHSGRRAVIGYDDLLHKWKHIFSTHKADYRCTDVVKHRIPTRNTEPIRERCRTVPPTLYKEVQSLLRA